MKKVINVVMSIECDYDEKSSWLTNEDVIDETAIDLTMNPCFSTIDSGVELISVHLLKVDKYKLIDWDKLEHNPTKLYIDTRK